MSKHQLIFTSCKRGLYSVYSGLHVFSNDKGVNSESEISSVNQYCNYTVPRLSEELINFLYPEYNGKALEHFYPKDYQEDGEYVYKDLWDNREEISDWPISISVIPRLPHAFMYQIGENNQYIMVNRAYLGFDYGGSERMGNYFSHIIWYDNDEKQEHYPCEYYKSDIFYEDVSSFDVSSDQKPDYLPDVELKPGNLINLNSVANFLRFGNRIDIYINMLHALMLSYEDTKKILIVDKEENIIFWIAAVEYALPLKAAKNIQFNTYCYNPDNTKEESNICGVLPCGTLYSYEKFKESCYVFDIINQRTVQLDNSNEFYDFVRKSFLENPNELKAFTDYMENFSTYEIYDEGICSAYEFYQFSKIENFSGLTVDKLKQNFKFSGEYISADARCKIADKIIRTGNNFVNCDNKVFALLTDFIFENSETLRNETITHLVNDVFFNRFLKSIANNGVDTDTAKCNFSYLKKAMDLMKARNPKVNKGFFEMILGSTGDHKLRFLRAMNACKSSEKLMFIVDEYLNSHVSSNEFTVSMMNIILRNLFENIKNNFGFSALKNSLELANKLSKYLGKELFDIILSNENYVTFIDSVDFMTVSSDEELNRLKIILEKYIEYLRTKGYLFSDNLLYDESPYSRGFKFVYQKLLKSEQGFIVSVELLDSNCHDFSEFLKLSKNIEKIIDDLSDEPTVLNAYRSSIYMYIVGKYTRNDIKCLNKLLMGEGKIDDVYKIYTISMDKAATPQAAEQIFNDSIENILANSEKYDQKYGKKALSIYYKRLNYFEQQNPKSCRVQIKALSEKIFKLDDKENRVDFDNDIIAYILDDIKFKSSMSIDGMDIGSKKLVEKIYSYQKKLSQPINNKVLLLLALYKLGGGFEDIKEIKDLGQKPSIKELGSEANEYIEEIKNKVYSMCRRGTNIWIIMSCYEMSKSQQRQLILACAELFANDVKKGSILIEKFGDYIILIIRKINDNEDFTKEFAKIIKSLKTSQIKKLSDYISKKYGNDEVKAWNEMMSSGTDFSFQNIFNGIGNLFGRKNKDK